MEAIAVEGEGKIRVFFMLEHLDPAELSLKASYVLSGGNRGGTILIEGDHRFIHDQFIGFIESIQRFVPAKVPIILHGMMPPELISNPEFLTMDTPPASLSVNFRSIISRMREMMPLELSLRTPPKSLSSPEHPSEPASAQELDGERARQKAFARSRKEREWFRRPVLYPS